MDDDSKDTDGEIIRTTKNVADSRRARLGGGKEAPQGEEPAVLLTDVALMRVKAKAHGVPAISTTTLKMHILNCRPNGGREDGA